MIHSRQVGDGLPRPPQLQQDENTMVAKHEDRDAWFKEHEAKFVDALEQSERIDGDPFSPRWKMHQDELTIRERLKVLRKAMGLSAKALGEKLDKRWAILKWESGEAVPSIESAARLVWFFQQKWSDFGLEDLVGECDPSEWSQ